MSNKLRSEQDQQKAPRNIDVRLSTYIFVKSVVQILEAIQICLQTSSIDILNVSPPHWILLASQLTTLACANSALLHSCKLRLVLTFIDGFDTVCVVECKLRVERHLSINVYTSIQKPDRVDVDGYSRVSKLVRGYASILFLEKVGVDRRMMSAVRLSPDAETFSIRLVFRKFKPSSASIRGRVVRDLTLASMFA